ncbi:ferredoxin-2, mitochondrial [Trichonephila clavata]|uniref:Ferredoxin-2, mitochondrial n=1 Tax=Trichonephila clavata TaxID=2740835 RepID=A0A8X6H441_TRICU|nr:ferredoxin-2, mitochondrial [Trichonephila clavata]
MSFSRVLSRTCFHYRSLFTRNQYSAVNLLNTNSRVSNRLLDNKARFFYTAGISMAEENSKRVKISFVIFETGEKVEVEGEIGQNILEVALANDVGMLGSCEGYVRCTICHVYVDDKSKEILPRATEEECDLIDRALDPKENSRLSCQCILSKNLEGAVFTLPLTTRNVELEDSKK